MTDPQHPTCSSPIFAALDEAVDDAVDAATEDLLVEVVSAIWYGFDSPEDIGALIEENANASDPVDLDKVKATAARELARKRAAEAGWPESTDCDRLDRAFARLHELGICALHCAGNTQEDGIEAVADVVNDDSTPEDRYHGYCFYDSQDVDHALDGEDLLLAHGHINRGEAEVHEHVAVARTICDALRHEGLAVDWDGRTHLRIGLPKLRWQRRTPG